MDLKAGTRLRSATDTTEVMVVRAPADPIDLRCGGAPLLPIDAEPTELVSISAGFEEGTLVGKRYADEDAGIEVLCTKGGPASLSIGETLLPTKGAKALPASD